MHLTDTQWDVVNPLIPQPKKKDGRGRPRRSDREILEGILWILKTGAQWSELPKDKYPPYQTCHRRFQEWRRKGLFENILRALAEDMEHRGKIRLEECFMDGSFASAKKGVRILAQPSGEKAQRSWRSEIKMVFRSPCTWILLARTKSDWWRKRLPNDLPERISIASWLTGPMTVTD